MRVKVKYFWQILKPKLVACLGACGFWQAMILQMNFSYHFARETPRKYRELLRRNKISPKSSKIKLGRREVRLGRTIVGFRRSEV